MAASDVALVLRIPARIVVNPTDLTAAFPYGGTELGLVREVVVRGHQGAIPIGEEAYGDEVVDVLDVGQNWTAECEFRGLDADAIQRIFPSYATGSVTGRTDVVYPGATFRAGTLRSAAAVKLMIAPLDTNRHPCWYFPNALPLVAEDAEERLQVDQEFSLKAFFQGTRDATGRVFLRRRLEDLTL